MWHLGLGSRAEGTGFGVPGVINLVGEELPVLAQGDYVNLSTRFDFHGHQFGAVFHWKLEPSVKGNLPIQCALGEQGTFQLNHGFNTVSEDHIYTILRVPEGGLLVMRSVKLVGGCTMGRAAGLATARAAVAWLPARGMICTVSPESASWSLGTLIASSQVVLGLSHLPLFLLPAQSSVVVVATAGIADCPFAGHLFTGWE